MAAGADGPSGGKGRKRQGKSRAKKGKAGGSGRKLSADERAQGQRCAAMIRAIDHPLRRRILRVFEDDEEMRSPGQIAKTLRMGLSAVSYQVTVLRRLTALRAAGSVPVRGTIEHFYRATIEGDVPIEMLLEETRELDEEEARRERRP